MSVCMNRLRDNNGEIIAYTLASNYGLQIVGKEELKEQILKHKIYVNNLGIDNSGNQ